MARKISKGVEFVHLSWLTDEYSLQCSGIYNIISLTLPIIIMITSFSELSADNFSSEPFEERIQRSEIFTSWNQGSSNKNDYILEFCGDLLDSSS